MCRVAFVGRRDESGFIDALASGKTSIHRASLDDGATAKGTVHAAKLGPEINLRRELGKPCVFGTALLSSGALLGCSEVVCAAGCGGVRAGTRAWRVALRHARRRTARARVSARCPRVERPSHAVYTHPCTRFGTYTRARSRAARSRAATRACGALRRACGALLGPYRGSPDPAGERRRRAPRQAPTTGRRAPARSWERQSLHGAL